MNVFVVVISHGMATTNHTNHSQGLSAHWWPQVVESGCLMGPATETSHVLFLNCSTVPFLSSSIAQLLKSWSSCCGSHPDRPSITSPRQHVHRGCEPAWSGSNPHAQPQQEGQPQIFQNCCRTVLIYQITSGHLEALSNSWLGCGQILLFLCWQGDI